MSKKIKIGIALLVPEDYALFVRKQEIYLAKKYNTIRGLLQPPHITVKWPFSVESIKPFEEYCESLAKEIIPFKIYIEGYGFFEKPRVIFLKVKSSDKLNKLHLKILHDLKEKFGVKKNKFEGTPHLQFHTTLAYEDIDEENFNKAKEELKNAKQPRWSFVFDSIGLFRFTGEEWVIHKKYYARK
jgi:2'-5' RNA ligase